MGLFQGIYVIFLPGAASKESRHGRATFDTEVRKKHGGEFSKISFRSNPSEWKSVNKNKTATGNPRSMESVLYRNNSGSDGDDDFPDTRLQQEYPEVKRVKEEVTENVRIKRSDSFLSPSDSEPGDEDFDSSDMAHAIEENLLRELDDKSTKPIKIEEETGNRMEDDIILPSEVQHTISDRELEQRNRDRQKRKELKSRKEAEEEEREKMQ